jgi:transcriptional regulator with XRE-family HTH domain
MKNDIYLKEVGSKIRAARKAKKMSMERLGEQINMNISNISFIERGRTNPHLLTLKSIADVLRVEVKDFI